MKKTKRRIKGWVWLLIGFILGIVYSNLFIYHDVIVKAEAQNKPIEKPKEVERVIIPEEVEKPVIEEKSCELDKISCLIKDKADEYGIDWKLAVAISKHETAVYTSKAFNELNNVGGNFRNGSLMKFASLEEGVDFYISNLKRGYIDMGLVTIEDIQPKYAPLGATNDPNNLNSYWVSGVYRFYNELGD